MSQLLKEKVLQHFKCDRTFDNACKIYRTIPGAHKGLIRRMNGGEHGDLLLHIHYNMAKAVGISEREMNTMLTQPLSVTQSTADEGSGVSKGDKPEPIIQFNPEEIPLEDIPKIDLEKADYYDLLALAVIRLGLNLPDRKGETVREALKNYLAQNLAKEVVATLPEEAVKAIRLRDQFPFLREDDCPDELKILTADRISTYYKYVEAHEAIQTKKLTEEQLAEASKTVVENYLENRLIWEELKHYQEHKEPLGKHPIWANKQKVDEIQALDGVGISKMINSLKSSKSNAKKNIKSEKAKEAPDAEKIAGWEKLIEEKNWLIEECDKRLQSFSS